MKRIKVFYGGSHPALCTSILDRLSISHANVTCEQRRNNETTIELPGSVRDEDVFIIQTGSGAVNDHLMELLAMINACKAACAYRVTAVIPFYPYAKHCKRKRGRGPITAKLIANMLKVAGVDRLVTFDLHSSQMQGFFQVPVDNLSPEPAFLAYIRDHLPNSDKLVIVAKNASGTKRVTSLADVLDADFGMLHKEGPPEASVTPAVVPRTVSSDDDEEGEGLGGRIEHADASEENQSLTLADGSVLTLVGHVKDRPVIILDDIIDKTETLIHGAYLLKDVCGATTVYVMGTHGLLSGDALQRIASCAPIEQLVVTNTYPILAEKAQHCPKLRVLDVTGTLAEAIRRTHHGESISYLFRAFVP